jgi:hypothetical protein
LNNRKSVEVHFRLFINGTIKNVIGKSSPLYNSEGELSGRIGTMLDLNEADQYKKMSVVN